MKVSKKYRKLSSDGVTDCPACRGKGFRLLMVCAGKWKSQIRELRRFDCSDCLGSGKVDAVEMMERVLSQ